MSLKRGDAKEQKDSVVKSIWFKLGKYNYRKRILPFIDPQPLQRPLRILDIGCGAGAQLDNIRELLPESRETFGVDINKTATDKARQNGHVVYDGRFEDVELPKGYFDIVYSIHVIEHVERPDLFIKKCLELLTLEGILLIETPNTDSLDYRIFRKRHWGGYHAPRHFYLFNVDTFRHLSIRLNAEIVAFAPYTTSVFLELDVPFTPNQRTWEKGS